MPGGPSGPGGPPDSGWNYEPPEPASKSRRGLIVTLIAVAVLIVVGIGGWVGWSLTNSGTTFAVNDCVKQQGNDGVKTECTDEGAYRITEIMETDNACPDPMQPTLQITERDGGRKYACLTPAAAPPADAPATESPAPTAEATP